MEEASRPVKIGKIEAVKPIKIPAGSVQPVIMTPKVHGKPPRRNPYEQEENKKSLCNQSMVSRDSRRSERSGSAVRHKRINVGR